MAGAALLIGNTRYAAPFNPLRTPRNDVENLGDRFHELGFDTYVVHDADRALMSSVIAKFREVVARLPERESVYIHFAGHGIQDAGENYLVPVDARGENPTEVLWSCIRLSDVMDALCWREDQQKIIVLDACRTNRIPTSSRDGAAGLAGVSPDRYDRVNETFVFYASAPGRVAADGAEYGSSPFCMGVLETLKDPHIPIATLAAQTTDFVFRTTGKAQKPWGTGNLCHLWPFLRGEEDQGTLVRSPVLSDGPKASTAGVVVAPSDRYIAERGHLIHKLKAKDTTGKWAYYFVLVEEAEEAAFLKAINGDGTLDIEDFGKVIASCYGEKPNEEVKAYLKERYGFAV